MKHLYLFTLLFLLQIHVNAQDGIDSSYGTNGSIHFLPQFYSKGSTANYYPTLSTSNDSLTLYGSCFYKNEKCLFIKKFKPNLEADTNFGKEGIQYIPFKTPEQILFVRKTSLGKLLFAGTEIQNNFKQFVMYQYQANGSTDSSFGNLGKSSIDLQLYDDLPTDILCLASGKILVSWNDQIQLDPSILRLNENGSLDSSFANNGKFKVQTSLDIIGLRLAVKSNGKILLACQKNFNNPKKISLLQFLGNGQIDSGFGTAGIQHLALGTANDDLIGLYISPNNELNVLANVQLGSASQLAHVLIKLDTNGNANEQFGSSGVVILKNKYVSNTFRFEEDNLIRIHNNLGIHKISLSGNLLSFDSLPHASALIPFQDKWIELSHQNTGKYSILNRSLINADFSRNNGHPFNIKNELIGTNLGLNQSGEYSTDSRNGKTLIAFSSSTPSGDIYKIVNVNQDGLIDTLFGENLGPEIQIPYFSRSSINIKWESDNSFLVAIKDSGDAVLYRFSSSGVLTESFRFKNEFHYNTIQTIKIAIDNKGRVLLGTFRLFRINQNGIEDSLFKNNFRGPVHSIFASKSGIIYAGLDSFVTALYSNGNVVESFGINGKFNRITTGYQGRKYNFKCIEINNSADGKSLILNVYTQYLKDNVSVEYKNQLFKMDFNGKNIKELFSKNSYYTTFNLQSFPNSGLVYMEQKTGMNQDSTNLQNNPFIVLKNDSVEAISKNNLNGIRYKPVNFQKLLPYYNDGLIWLRIRNASFSFTKLKFEQSKETLIGPDSILASKRIVGFGEKVELQCKNLNENSSYKWSIEPNTFRYLNETDSSSMRPQIVFGKSAYYSIRVVVTQKDSTYEMFYPAYVLLKQELDFIKSTEQPQLNEKMSLKPVLNGEPLAYHWSFSPNEIEYTNGSDSNSREPEFKLSQRAWYDVQLQVVFADTTIELKKINFIYITAVGLKEVRNEKEMFEVWPNPSSGIINIKNKINSSPFEIELLSMEGKLLLKTNSNELNRNELELPPQNGFFILRMKCENETYFYKIQKVN